MKFKVTNKELKNSGEIVVQAPYGMLTHLLRGVSPIASNCGAHGWNYDLYQVGCIFVCTGRRNLYGEFMPTVFDKYELLSIAHFDVVEELRKQFVLEVCSEWAKHNTVL